MSNMYLSDDYGFKWKVGDTTNGLNALPIFGAIKVNVFNLTENGSIAIDPSFQLRNWQSFYVGDLIYNNINYVPVAVSGYKLTCDDGFVMCDGAYVEVSTKLLWYRLTALPIDSSVCHVTEWKVRVIFVAKDGYNTFMYGQ